MDLIELNKFYEMFGDDKFKIQLQFKVKYGYYISHSVQNELISIIAICIKE